MTGQPQPGATVSLSSDGHEVAFATADAQGPFLLTVAVDNIAATPRNNRV